MRASRNSSVVLILALCSVFALVAACSPATGALGTASTPAPTADASVAPPSGDATPGQTDTAIASPTATDASPTSSASTSATTSAAATAMATAGPTSTPTPTTPVGVTPTGTTVVRAYFVLGSFTGNAGLAPVLREIPGTTGVATAAMRQLLAGPNAAELAARPAMYTAIPAAARLLGLAIQGGVATVDLSSEFDTGYSPAKPDARFAQVAYTLTQFATVKVVNFELDGSPIPGPSSRADFHDMLPAIFVDHPAWGAGAGNPVAASGVANVFEATFRVQVKDAGGRVLADQQVQASCGTGCWGTFSTSVAYTVSRAQWGTLRVYDLSAKDGTPVDVTEYPVWLTPAG